MENDRPLLLVEDDEVLAATLAEALGLAGFAVLALPSAERALEAIAKGFWPGAVLADLWLPGLTGAQLALTLAERKRPPPVVLMTGDILLAPPRGCFAILTKPVPMDVLIETCSRAGALRNPP